MKKRRQASLSSNLELTNPMMRLTLLIALVIVVACSTPKPAEITDGPKPVVTSLLGVSYFEPGRTAAQQARLDSNLQVAKARFDKDPSEDNYIWYGRRTAYLMRLEEAVAIYTEGLGKYPDSYRLLRHRGHRYISLRKFDEAIADLTTAATLMKGKPLEPEPDGIPNKLNVMLSTTQFNVFYHLALAHYLKGDFAASELVWNNCLSVCENDDSRVAVVDWLYMTLSRQGKKDEAQRLLSTIGNDVMIIENDSYYSRIKMYQGQMQPEDLLTADSTANDYHLALATQGYGVGNWYICHGEEAKAEEVFKRVVAGKEFAAFGFIASEAELARAR